MININNRSIQNSSIESSSSPNSVAPGINRFVLQIIAVAAMVIDHFAIVYIDCFDVIFTDADAAYIVCRAVGRLSFPIIIFLLTQGYIYTGNIKKYIMRIFAFAVISEIPYQLAIHGKLSLNAKHNVLWTILVCLFVIMLMDKIDDVCADNHINALIYKIAAAAAATVVSVLLNLDYAYMAVPLAFFFVEAKEKAVYRCAGVLLVNILYGGLQIWGAVSAVPIALYNGSRGPFRLRWLFYIFYPVHLLILWLFKVLI